MTSRERVQKAIGFSGPDRPPVMHQTLIGAWLRHGDRLKRLYETYPADIVSLAFSDVDEYDAHIGEGVRDPWGALWIRLTDEYKGQVVDHPLADWNDLAGYSFPDPLATNEFSQVSDLLAREGHEKYVLVDGGTLFQRMFYLRPLDDLLVDLVQEDERMMVLRDKVLDHILARIHAWSEVGVDGVSIRDDWGAQDRLMIAPSLWRRLFKPCYTKICEEIHKAGLNAHMHTDGFTIQIIPDLIESGFDEINPQHSVMDMTQLLSIMGGKVCLRTDIDRQHLLPTGTPDEVRANVRQIKEMFRDFSGGLVLSGQVASDVPLANATAMLETFYSDRDD